MNHENKEIPSENAFETKASNLFLRNIFLIAIGMIISHFLINSNPIIINKSSKFDELLSLIQNHYVDSLDYSNIENKAVNNLLSLLDPHSVYIPKEELVQSNEPLVGNFDGIGVEFYIANDTLIVVSPITPTIYPTLCASVLCASFAASRAALRVLCSLIYCHWSP
jgi:hypothetical protein